MKKTRQRGGSIVEEAEVRRTYTELHRRHRSVLRSWWGALGLLALGAVAGLGVGHVLLAEQPSDERTWAVVMIVLALVAAVFLAVPPRKPSAKMATPGTKH